MPTLEWFKQHMPKHVVFIILESYIKQRTKSCQLKEIKQFSRQKRVLTIIIVRRLVSPEEGDGFRIHYRQNPIELKQLSLPKIK
jgi:hypothetical protein